MKITSETLRRLLTMPEQAMVAALTFLAEQLEADEHKRTVNLTRQKRYVQRKNDVSSTSNERQNDDEMTPLACVEDKSSLSSPLEEDNLSLSLSKPLPKNPRALGTNPRAIAKEPQDFADFMAVYPRRGGSVDRKAALKAWEPAKKRGDLTAIMDGARRYNAEMTAKGKIGSEFVKQARTWLNADGWTEYQPVSAPLASVPKMARIIEDSPAFAAWTKHNGKRPMVTEARVDGVIRRVAYVPTEFPTTTQDSAA
jgi:hypothetical protein